MTLLSQSNPPAPDVILKAALIRRAMADVQRAMRIREDKPALQSLLQKGSINDSLWNSLLAAEKELEAEVLEVMHEANSFAQGWGQFIFNTAGEIVQNERTRKVFEDIPKLKAELGELPTLSPPDGSVVRGDLIYSVKLEEKYHPKKKKVTAPVPQAPSSQADVNDEKPKIEEKESATPSTTSSTLASSDSTKPNGLAPPPSNLDAESVTSMSDGELVSSSTPSIKNARHTPSKSVCLFSKYSTDNSDYSYLFPKE